MKLLLSVILVLLVCQISKATDKIFSVFSPDKRTEVKIALGEKITYALNYDGKVLIAPSTISIELYNGKIIGANPGLSNKKTVAVNNQLKPLYGKNAVINESYNELKLTFRENYSITFRAFNDGTAYRFTTSFKDSLKIKNEEATFSFPQNCKGYYRKGKKENYIYEAVYENADISKIDSGRVAIIPLLVQIPDGPKIAITESDITDYPGMYLTADANALKGAFRNFPLETNIDDHKEWSVLVTKTTD